MAYDAVFVLVNDTQWGGCAGGLVFSSLASGFGGIITHELGHKTFGLADEYAYTTSTYTGSEPSAPNCTIQLAPPAVGKWDDLIVSGTPIPTTVDSPPGVVGLWEGCAYRTTGIYRPQSTCHMRATGSSFCAQCERVGRNKLTAKCSFCELNPVSLLCRTILLPDVVRVEWLDPFEFRFPLPFCPHCPVCLTCPFEEFFFDDIVYTLGGAPDGFVLLVVDDSGNIVAQGDRVQNQLVVAFQARRDTQYFFELTSSDKPTGAALQLSSSLFRNEVEQALPAGP